MIIVDSNTVISCFKNSHALKGSEIVVPDDLYEEYLAAEIRHRQKINGLQLASTIKGYDEAAYLRKYAEALNSYSQVSFDKMRGLGDVSIIALVACMTTEFGKALPQTSLDLGTANSESIIVVTDDGHLKKKLQKDFDGLIEIISYEEFIKR